MIDEVAQLIQGGISFERMMYYGLEYKYIALYLKGDLTCDEMFTDLNIAIHQFAKRQMTWFRRMERNGLKINWLDANLGDDYKLDRIMELLQNDH